MGDTNNDATEGVVISGKRNNAVCDLQFVFRNKVGAQGTQGQVEKNASTIFPVVPQGGERVQQRIMVLVDNNLRFRGMLP